jgi:hypothetical protein
MPSLSTCTLTHGRSWLVTCWVYRNRRIAVEFGTVGLHRKLLCVDFTFVFVGLIWSPTWHEKNNQFLLDFTTIESLHRVHCGLNCINIWSVLRSSCLGYDFRYFYRLTKCKNECVRYNVTPAVWSALKKHWPYPWAISGFHRCVNESFALLGCYAALIGSYKHFGTTDRSHL